MNEEFQHLAGLDALKAWLAKYLPLFQGNDPLAPRSIVLTGLPGTGKRSVAKAIAASIGKPLVRFVPEQQPDPSAVLMVEDLDREHLPLIRRLADHDEPMPFVIALTERPWELPSGLLRADAVEAVWHLDLPDMKERAETWGLAATRHGHDQSGFDSVILARASHEFTPAEIHAAYARAARERHPRPPKERHLFDALIELQPLVDARASDMLRLAHWTHRRSTSARGG